MTMTYCSNCQQDVHITTTDCCDDPSHSVPDGLKASEIERQEAEREEEP